MVELISLLEKEKIGNFVIGLLNSTIEEEQDKWRGFWRMLGSDSSITSFVCARNIEILQNLDLDNTSCKNVIEVKENFPFLLPLLGHMTDHQKELVMGVMTYICQEAMKLLKQTPSDFPHEGPIEESKREYFPTLPKIRKRGQYPLDRNSIKNQSCRKQLKGHPYLGPGLFTIFCVHGKSKSSYYD